MSEALELNWHQESELTEAQAGLAHMINDYIDQATAIRKQHGVPKPFFLELDNLDFSDAVGLDQPAIALDKVKAQWSVILANPSLNQRALYPRFDQPAVFDRYLDDGHIEETVLYRLSPDVALVTVIDFDENGSVSAGSRLWVARDEINGFIRDNEQARITPHPLTKSKLYPPPSEAPSSHPVAHS